MDKVEETRLEITMDRISEISSAFEAVTLEKGSVPAKLRELDGHYVDSDPGQNYLDGWKRPFELIGETRELRSLGADGIRGTPDDIIRELPPGLPDHAKGRE